ncbi:MAG: polyprenyl synthetase family protein [Planctomycetes bacterium]|nr:polyprenyl synthetase family protein [Planctomycetota bacterium]
MSASGEVEAYLASERALVDAALREFLPPPEPEVPWLREAIEYSLLAPGKRLRPILALASARVCGGDLAEVLPVACAFEMIHTFSLVHDDLPAMDDDDLRRGRPTCHVQFGEPFAILAGDGLAAWAFRLVAERTPDPALASGLVCELAAGTMDMILGQVADMKWQGREVPRDTVRGIHRRKTAALLRGAVRAGAIAARAGEGALERLTAYGEAIGLAFQIADDLLDVGATSEELGKGAGKDAAKGKITYPGTFGIEESRRMARELADRAVEAALSLPGGTRLADLARYVVERKR